jgi:hypothetical protein
MSDFWHHLASIKTPNVSERFSNIISIVQYLLALPFLYVIVEQFFSSLKDVKTDHRNSLKIVTLTLTILAKLVMKTKRHVSHDLDVNAPS